MTWSRQRMAIINSDNENVGVLELDVHVLTADEYREHGRRIMADSAWCRVRKRGHVILVGNIVASHGAGPLGPDIPHGDWKAVPVADKSEGSR